MRWRPCDTRVVGGYTGPLIGRSVGSWRALATALHPSLRCRAAPYTPPDARWIDPAPAGVGPLISARGIGARRVRRDRPDGDPDPGRHGLRRGVRPAPDHRVVR